MSSSWTILCAVSSHLVQGICALIEAAAAVLNSFAKDVAASCRKVKRGAQLLLCHADRGFVNVFSDGIGV